MGVGTEFLGGYSWSQRYGLLNKNNKCIVIDWAFISTSLIENTNLWGYIGLFIVHLTRSWLWTLRKLKGTKFFQSDNYTYKVHYLINIIWVSVMCLALEIQWLLQQSSHSFNLLVPPTGALYLLRTIWLTDVTEL